MNKAYVICANDSVECVSMDEEKAEGELERIAKERYDATNGFNSFGRKMSYEEYRRQVYWHIHEVPVI